MKDNWFNRTMYWLVFHFWVIVYFLEGSWKRIWGLKEWQPPVVSTGVNLLDDGEVNLTPKPSASDALANKAKFGVNNIPEEYKKTIMWVITAIVFFCLFGVVDFVIRMIQLIKAYPVIGYALLIILIAYITYRISKSVYLYFKNNKHKRFIPSIKELWALAILRTQIRYTTK